VRNTPTVWNHSQIQSATSTHIGVHHPGILPHGTAQFCIARLGELSFPVTTTRSIWGNSDKGTHLHGASICSKEDNLISVRQGIWLFLIPHEPLYVLHCCLFLLWMVFNECPFPPLRLRFPNLLLLLLLLLFSMAPFVDEHVFARHIMCLSLPAFIGTFFLAGNEWNGIGKDT
jgi:hypothetical protein